MAMEFLLYDFYFCQMLEKSWQPSVKYISLSENSVSNLIKLLHLAVLFPSKVNEYDLGII